MSESVHPGSGSWTRSKKKEIKKEPPPSTPRCDALYFEALAGGLLQKKVAQDGRKVEVKPSFVCSFTHKNHLREEKPNNFTSTASIDLYSVYAKVKFFTLDLWRKVTLISTDVFSVRPLRRTVLFQTNILHSDT